MYDDNAPKLVQGGYYPLPTAPADFKPAKAPVQWVPSLGKFALLPGWNTRASPLLTPQPGANIGVRCGGGLIAVDMDCDIAAPAVSAALPKSPVEKRGQRGWTSFYRADFDVPSEDFFDATGKKVVQILSVGRQTVIPPSIHPETGEPYQWVNGHSLYDTALTDLSLLPTDYRARIKAAGYSFAAKSENSTVMESVDPVTGEITTDDPWRELNEVALRNLAAWVPALNLYKCKRRVGRFANYDAVAKWRPSTEGRSLEERAPNLRISGLGIKDFGDGRGYTPIDLVMAARGCGESDAFDWLSKLVLPPKPDIKVDWESITAPPDAPSIAPPEDDDGNGEKPTDDIYDLKPYRLKDESETKPRPWVAYKHYLLGTVSSTVAPGAVGKTSNNLVEACSMALGKDLFTGLLLKRRYRVWYHSAEETPEEMDLRLAAIAKHYGFSREQLGDWLYVTCGFDVDIKASTRGKTPVLNMATRNKIIRTIIEED